MWINFLEKLNISQNFSKIFINKFKNKKRKIYLINRIKEKNINKEN
jgi:hypothetical protein